MLNEEVIHTDTLILGAGPTGLGAARRLHQYQHPSWLVIDSFEKPGGLASTYVTDNGFLFDVGGHVIFSHYKYFDEACLEALPKKEDWYHHERVSYVRSRNTWVPYPYQNNIAALPKEDQIICLNGMVDASIQCALAQKKPKTFDEWILRMMGDGIANLFMRPYNFKVWAIPTTEMQCEWLGERVAAPDLKRAIKNVIENRMEGNWGPNATFRFPARGGTGGLWSALYEKTLPSHRFLFNTTVTHIDPLRKQCKTNHGHIIHYQTLISTIPLDVLVNSLPLPLLPTSDQLALSKAKQLTYSHTHVIGLGLRGRPPSHLAEKCWLYFPESDCPFYRVTVFSNYSPHHVPTHALPTLRKVDPQLLFDTNPKFTEYWSLMFEVSESKVKPVNAFTVLEETIQGALATELVTSDMELVSLYHQSFEHGYPTPTLDRDELLAHILPCLETYQIYSRGRFGSWKYEVGNQDHSFMLGVEVVDRIFVGAPELTLNYPNIINQRTNGERTLTPFPLTTTTTSSSSSNQLLNTNGWSHKKPLGLDPNNDEVEIPNPSE